MADLHLSLNNMTLEQKINQFRDDPEKMQEVNDFLNEVFEKAKLEAALKQNSKHKKFDSPNLQNGTKRIGAWSNRARSSARTFATRMFTAICNCTNSVRNVTNAAINRN